MRAAPEGKKPMLVELKLPVKTYDIDFTGAVSNIAYSRWLEDLRCLLLQGEYPLSRMIDEGFAPLLSATQIKYKQVIRLFDSPMGSMWVAGISEAGITVHADIIVQGQVMASAIQKCVFLKMPMMRPVRVPREIRATFEQCCVD